MKTTKKGFTLIELLIVVAIIAILAAIAVPNFLEAQVRAKVSRAKADQRTLATALETYYVDHNAYPPNAPPAAFLQGNPLAPLGPEPGAFVALTTPISYLSTGVLIDPFGSLRAPSGIVSMGYLHIEENDSATFLVVTTLAGAQGLSEGVQKLIYELRWDVTSRGPDRVARVEEINGSLFSGISAQDYVDWTLEFESAPLDLAYDPTNGTISGGDITRTAKGIFSGRELLFNPSGP